MITENDVFEIERRVGPNLRSRFIEYLHDKGERNSWGNPWRKQNLTEFWQGKREIIYLEELLIEFEEDHNRKIAKIEARRKKLKNKVA